MEKEQTTQISKKCEKCGGNQFQKIEIRAEAEKVDMCGNYLMELVEVDQCLYCGKVVGDEDNN